MLLLFKDLMHVTYYQQVFGTAMGSPVSAVIANIVLEDVVQRALATSLV